jgi:hypothetical protein
MLFYLVAWALLFGVCLMVGTSVLSLVGCPSAIERPADRLLATLWVGLLTLATALLALSIVAPLRPHWCALVAAGLSLPALWSKESLQTLKAYRGFCTLPVVLGVLVVSSASAWLVLRGTISGDAHIYHIPRVRWYSEYGTPFGLALLEAHLGLTSSWHTLTAVFDVTPFRGRTYAAANGFLCALFMLNFLVVGQRIYKRQALDSDIFLATVSVVYFAAVIRRLNQIVYSPSPDIAVVFSFATITWLFWVEPDSLVQRAKAAWLASLGALGLKLSLAPLLATVALAEFWRVRNYPSLVQRFITLVIAYTLPFLMVQFISTGYFLYPVTIPNFSLDWSLPPETVEWEAKLPIFIAPFKPIPDSYHSAVPADYGEMTLTFLRNQKSFIFLSIINLSICSWIIFIVRPEKIIYLIATIGLIGNVFILASGPDGRYGFSYVRIGLVLLFVILVRYVNETREKMPEFLFRLNYFYLFLFITALTFLPLRVSTGAAILALVGGSALVLLPFRHSVWLRTRSLPWQWAPLVAALTVAAGVAATACAKDQIEMAIESYAGAGLLRLPENSVSTWLLPPPTIRFYLTRGPNGELIPANSRYEIKTVRGYQYVYPVEGVCGDAELPCGSFGIRPDILWRDPKRGLAGGFSRAK